MKFRVDARSEIKIGCLYMKMMIYIDFLFDKKSKKSNVFMSIPNVYPGPLRSVKQPGKAKTA